MKPRESAIGAVGALAALLAGLLCAQAPSFDAASIRPLPSPDGPAHFNVYPNRLDVKNMNLRVLIEDAYALPDFELSGLESARSTHYDIAATTAAPVSRDQMRELLANLLAERFHLKTHWDPRIEPVFRLEKLPGALKMKASDVGYPLPNSPFRDGETIRLMGPMSMHQLADSLNRYAGKPVIDATNLEGYFTIALTFASEEINPGGNGGGTAPFLKNAIQEQLGLKLTPVQEQIKILVVDHADDKPTEN